MPLSALALVVLAGFIHACWNIAAKKAGGDVRFVAFTSVVLMVFWAPVGLWVGWTQVPAWGLLAWALVLAIALLGGHLLGEKDRGPRIAGAALIAAGVMALGMG